MASRGDFLAVPDAFPVSPGHTLVVPRRHVSSFFDLTASERRTLLELLDSVKSHLEQEHHADGFNIGWNDGREAGQTVLHFHLHVIPRYRGDVKDPRGGLRWIFPAKADYWSAV